MIVEMGKEYRLANGSDYRLFCTDAGGGLPVLGARYNKDTKNWVPVSHRADGQYHVDGTGHSYDLVEVKPRINGEFWLAHLSREQVVALTEYPCATHTVWNVEPIAITHHTYDCEEGEGLK